MNISLENYPDEAFGDDFVASAWGGLTELLESSKHNLFDEVKTNVAITDIGEDEYRSARFSDAIELETAIRTKPSSATRLRIVTIYSKSTLLKLEVSSNTMCEILREYAVHPDFVDILMGYKNGPHIAEGCSHQLSIRNCTTTASTSLQSQDLHKDSILMYQFRYHEETKTRDGVRKSIRHTAVYHHHRADTASVDYVIILQPTESPSFDERLAWLGGSGDRNKTDRMRIAREPLLFHRLLSSTYSPGWRKYARTLGAECSAEIDKAIMANLNGDDDTDQRDNVMATFNRVQTLRNIEDKILAASSHCAGNLEILNQLSSTIKVSPGLKNALAIEMTRYHAYIDSLGALRERLRSTTDLVGYTLNIHNQLEACRISTDLKKVGDSLESIAKESLDESGVAVAFGIISVFYLPAGLAGSLFQAMVVNASDTEKGTFRRWNLGIFMLAWLPGVVLTTVIFLLCRWWSPNKRRRDAAQRQRDAPTDWSDRMKLQRMSRTGLIGV